MRSSPPRAHMSPSKSHEHQVFTDIKSSCGEQVDSRKATAPMPVFGSGTRPHTTNGSKAPGPGTYQIPSSIGKPVLSTMAQAPSCSISGREKFGSTADLTTSARLPGPGDYNSDIVNPRERAAPSYSLGKKWSSMDGDERIPGPGAYEASTTIGRTVLSTQKSNPVSSFPKVERKPLHASGTADVGPGQYSVVVESVGRQTVSTVPSGASYSFGTETRSKSVRSTGKYKYYDPKSSVGTQVESTYRTAPKCSMSGRPQTSNMSPPRPLGSPVNQTFTDVKSSCGGQVDSRKATAPGAVFGSGTRPHTTNGSKAPGPGAYQIPSTIGKAPSCSISGREKFGSTADLTTSARLPGPGDYNSDIVNPRERAAPSYSLGKKWSSMDGDERIPGPGAYEASTTIGRTVLSTQKSNPVSSFPKVERKPLHASGTADVGPGQYSVVVESVGRQTVSTVPSGASYSFGTETRSKSVRSTGKYKYYDPKSSVGTQVESTYRTAPKCSMSGRPQTSNMSPPRPLGSPVNQTFTDVKSSCGGQVDSRKATAPGAVFGSGTRPHTTNGSKAPGPGAYQIPSTIGKAPSCSISGREKFGSTADLTTSARLPGPGDYNSDIVNPRERAAPSYSLGKKWSSMDGDERIPGPGAYEASTTIGRTVLSTQKSNPVSSFPKVERKPLHASGTADVGPGQYSVVVESVGRQTVSTVPSGASYSFGTETRSKSVRSTGKYKYYDPKSSVGTQVESTYRTAPKCSMSGRPQTSNMSPPRPLGSPVNQTFTDVKSSCGGQVDSRKATAPGAVFGSGTRPHTTNGSKAPGPGAYQIPSTIGKAPSCSISGREKFGSTADLTTSARLPGPGDYNSDIVNPRERAAPSYSLGKKWSSMDGDERIPGPGAYEASTTIGRTVLSTQKSNPVSSFPKVERKPLHASGTADVGPGQYSVVVESVGRQTVSTVPSGASYSFGTETRSKSVRSTGKYKYYDPKSSVGTQVESTYRTAPKCSMSGRPQTSNMSPPRPLGSPVNQTFTDVKSSCGGQVDSRKATAPGAVFGSGTRPHTTNGSKAPGPGAYQIPSTIGKAPSCSISGREKFGSTADLTTSARLPGPGDYNSDIVNPRERAAPSYSLGKKWSSMDGDERIPGPGAYEASTTIGRTVLSTQKSNPVSSFPKVERKPLHASGTADVGPGQYSVVVESVGRQTVSTVPSGASYSFGTETRSKSVRSTGKYKYYDPKSSVGTQVESTYRTAPKCSMSGRPQTSNMSPPRPLGSPVNQTFTDVKSSCGGQVDSRKATAPGAVFGSGTRPHTTNGSKAPGPGAYQIPSTIGKAPSCSISGREKFGSTADLTTSARLPGPGDYNSDIVNPRERAAPSYSLGKKWSSMDGDERIPGPGAYEASTTIGRTVLSTQKSNPVSSFPKVERKPLHASGTADVGPGQYSVVVESVGRQTVSTVPSGASYSFGTETRSKSVRSTGKYKYYDPKSSVGTQVESTYRTAPKCSMSGRPQTSNMSPPRPLGSPVNQTFTDVKSSCGGQVDSRKATAPGAVFGSGTRPHTTNGSKAPGPGAYQIPSTIGKAPSCSISGREKFGSTADLTTSARLPGPGDYNSDIVNPRERAAPSYSLGKKWSSMDGDERIPGPGAYEASTTIGRTVLSTQKSNPVSSFPKVERKPLHASGTADVGPGQYSVVVESVGRQTVSTVPSGASYSFGTETRSKSVRSTGKYKYYDPKSSVGTQVESTYRTAPKCSMSGRPQTSNMSPPRPLGSPVNQTFTDVKSSCGGQVDSRKATAPGAVFGSDTRPHTTNGSKAPGPGAYQIPSTIGKAPSCSISGREKFGSTADLTTSARLPGPGDYNSDIVNPRERAAPSYSLGKKWSSMDGDERIPGPGAYEASTTIGRTVLSTQKSNPVSSFPKVERKPLHASGTADVGPGQYSVVVESVGRQTVSTATSGASYSFGTDTRSKSVRSTGKYKYYDPKSSVGTQVESLYRTAPKCTISGRTKFGGHF